MYYILFIIIIAAFLLVTVASDTKHITTTETAIFAGGCFWCMEQPFRDCEGVIEVTVGYTGGTEINPNYTQVASGTTSHLEAVKVVYDPARISYLELLHIFWRQIDPTDGSGQFADRGHHYTTAIYYSSEQQRVVAEKSKNDLDQAAIFDEPVVTPILPATPFYPAEDYHQQYYRKNESHYNAYKMGSGRVGFLLSVWNGQDFNSS